MTRTIDGLIQVTTKTQLAKFLQYIQKQASQEHVERGTRAVLNRRIQQNQTLLTTPSPSSLSDCAKKIKMKTALKLHYATCTNRNTQHDPRSLPNKLNSTKPLRMCMMYVT